MTATMSAQDALLELHIKQEPDGLVDPVVPLRWCFNQAMRDEVLELLHSNTDYDAWLVIIDRTDRHSYHNQTRKVLPLEQEMQFMSFSRPGKHRLTAFVLLGSRGRVETLVLERFGSNYENSLFTGEYERAIGGEYVYEWPYLDVEALNDSFGVNVVGLPAELDVVVPAELFSKEPPQWLKNYMGMFFRRKLEDQCHLRRRMLAMIPLLPVVFVLSMMARTVALTFSLLLTGKANFRAFRSPFGSNIKDVLSEDEEMPDKIYKIPLTYVITSLLLFVSVIKGSTLLQFWKWGFLAVTVAAIGFGLWYYLDTTETDRRNRRVEASRLREAQRKHREAEYIKAMVCETDTQAKPVSLAELPKDKRTVKLRFAAAKSKVCRPYAR